MKTKIQRNTYKWNYLKTKCSNCGSTDDLQVHHIVPVSVGGKNIESNVICLCEKCHRLVHHGSDSENWNRTGGGRPNKYEYKQIKPYYESYANGEMSTHDLAIAMGYEGTKSEHCFTRSLKGFNTWSQYLDEIGAIRITNTIDMIRHRHECDINEGAKCGIIEYKDGRIENIYYKHRKVEK